MKTKLALLAVLALAGCASPPAEETGADEGAATAAAPTASKATFEKVHPWTKIHVSHPVIAGGDFSDAEAAATNEAIKAFAESLVAHPPIDGRCSPDACDYFVDCVATLATRDLTAVACEAFEATRIRGATETRHQFSHAALHFVPRAAEKTALRALLGGAAEGTVERSLIGEYAKVSEETWGIRFVAPDDATKTRMFDTAVVTPYGLILQEGASGHVGYGSVSWNEIAGAVPKGGLLARLAAERPPTPTGAAAWRWR